MSSPKIINIYYGGVKSAKHLKARLLTYNFAHTEDPVYVVKFDLCYNHTTVEKLIEYHLKDEHKSPDSRILHIEYDKLAEIINTIVISANEMTEYMNNNFEKIITATFEEPPVDTKFINLD